ncbi:hypothetical protein [Nostoc sp.]|uniref:hypothetical protein n=1 Tax=Nostoc sp. TaxID=1180 RepID=UPI002FF72FA1
MKYVNLISDRSWEKTFWFTDNIGKIIAINITTGDYEIDNDFIVACYRLQTKQPNAIIWTERIGYDAVYAVGGTLVRTAK